VESKGNMYRFVVNDQWSYNQARLELASRTVASALLSQIELRQLHLSYRLDKYKSVGDPLGEGASESSYACSCGNIQMGKNRRQPKTV
jgi:hypothetical protein